MNRRTKQIGVGLAIVAIVGFAGWRPIKTWLGLQAASAALEARTKALVEKNPQFKPAWDEAMQDKFLSYSEAKTIVEGAGEKVGSDE